MKKLEYMEAVHAKYMQLLAAKREKFRKGGGSSGGHELIWWPDKRKKKEIFQDLEEFTKFQEYWKSLKVFSMFPLTTPEAIPTEDSVCLPPHFQLQDLMLPCIC